MTEVTLLAFWTLSLSRFLSTAEGSSKTGGWLICAGCLLGASFISLVAAGLVLLMGPHDLFSRLDGAASLPVWKILLLPLALWFGWLRRFSLRVFLVILMLSVLPFSLWVRDWSSLQVTLFAVFFSSGLIVLWQACPRMTGLVSRWKHSRPGAVALEVLLALWFFGILASYLLVYYSGTVRYLLLALPPPFAVVGEFAGEIREGTLSAP